MDHEQLIKATEDKEDFWRRKRELFAKGRENQEIFDNTLEEIRHLIRAASGMAPEKKKIGGASSPNIILAKNLEFQELGSGHLLARVHPERSGPDQKTYLFTFYFRPNLVSATASNERKETIDTEVFSDRVVVKPRHQFDEELLAREEQIIAKSTQEVTAMIETAKKSLIWLTNCAMDPELNPQLAERVQNYYLELTPLQSATITDSELSSEAS